MDQEESDSPPSAKRQRLSLDGNTRESGTHSTTEHFATRRISDVAPAIIPPSPLPGNHATPRRFVFAQSQTSPSFANPIAFPDELRLQSLRPAFLKPPSVPPDTTEPLPEAFSPHRRGQKFVPGGMASEVRQWIVDATHATSHSHARRGAGDPSRVRVMECRGTTKDGLLLVRGSVEGKEARLILPSAGKNKNASKLVQGDLLGIKAPSWEIELDGSTWVVAADWSVLPD
jgi:hypothetical protein